MIRPASTAIALISLAAVFSSAAAEPVTLQCRVISKDIVGKDRFGRVVLTIDETARTVGVRFPNYPALANDFRNAALGPVVTGHADFWDGKAPTVAQFVNLTPSAIQFGWRWPDDGSLGHLLWIDRAALARRQPCRIHSVYESDSA